MKITYEVPVESTQHPNDFGGSSYPPYSKIGAIKAIRSYNQMALKACKEAVEEAVEKGSVIVPDGDGNISELRDELKKVGNFDVSTTLTELHDAIEHAIELSVNIRQYNLTKSLIMLLPPEKRTGDS